MSYGMKIDPISEMKMDLMSGMEMVRNRIETQVWSSIEIGIGFDNEWINHNDRIDDVAMAILQLTFPRQTQCWLVLFCHHGDTTEVA